MRKVLYFAATIAALFATGCSSDEVVESASKAQKAITFENAFIDKSTRGTTATDPSTTLDNLDEFLAYGFQANSLLFKGQSVTKNGTDWTYSPLKYWVTGAAYNFIGVANLSSDATAAATLEADNSGSKVLTLTISDFESDGETDLLASAQVAKTGAQDNTPVELTFKHLLSKVKFTFKNGFTADDDATLKVTDVTITDAYKKGKVTVSGTTPTIAWSDQSSNDLELEFGKTGEISPTGKDEAEYEWLLIPTTEDKDYTVTFKVSLIANANSDVEGAGEKFVTAIYPQVVTVSGVEFKAGNSYNLVANIDKNNISDDGINPIEFVVKEISSWETNSDITFPSEDTDAEEGGEEEAEVK